jgi:hypothetical protein
MSATKTWTPAEVRQLSLSGAKILREQVLLQLKSESRSARQAAQRLLPIVDSHIGGFSPQAVAQRADAARSFLHPQAQDDAQARWKRAVDLHGGERAAKQAGYKPPGEAA